MGKDTLDTTPQHSRVDIKQVLMNLLIVGLPILVGFGVMSVVNARHQEALAQMLVEQEEEIFEGIYEYIDEQLTAMDIGAQGVMVYDIPKERSVYERDAHVPRGLASLTKMMTALVALEEYEPAELIEFSEKALSQYGSYDFTLGEKWHARDLTRAMLVNSANDAAFALSEHHPDFMIRMNSRAKELGLSSLRFDNPTGLDNNGVTTSLGSPHDSAQLAAYLYTHHREDILFTQYPEVEFKNAKDKTYLVENTHVDIEKVRGLVFSKTGYTDSVGGNLVIIVEPYPMHPVVVVILESTFTGRFDDVRRIADMVYSSYHIRDFIEL